ncbi:MAG: helix-turn-helix transcriptional regulator [Mesorhizobium sp.]|nr:MAG: helix-turn-helix transcriptional regulator [Mesorhizobium sp.]
MSDHFINLLAPTGLKAFRERAGVSQTDMAKAMGMPYRSYQALEYGQNAIKPFHTQAAHYAILKLSDQLQDPDLIDGEGQELIMRLALLIAERMAETDDAFILRMMKTKGTPTHADSARISKMEKADRNRVRDILERVGKEKPA